MRKRNMVGTLSRIASIGMLFYIYVIFASVYAQDDELSNKDYFLHSTSPELKALVDNVERYHQGEQFWTFYNSGEYYYALDDIKYILGVFPNHPKALHLLGAVARLTDNPSLPIPWYQNALNLFPQYALTRAQYGSYLSDIGKLNEGISELKKAIRTDPKLALAHVWLAEAYHKLGSLALAQQAAEQARALGYKGEILEGTRKN